MNPAESRESAPRDPFPKVLVNKSNSRFSAWRIASRLFPRKGKVRLALYYQKGEVPREPLLRPGDQVEVLANLRLPKNFNNPGQFDYVAYLERQDVALVGTVKSELLITRLATGQGSWLVPSNPASAQGTPLAARRRFRPRGNGGHHEGAAAG